MQEYVFDGNTPSKYASKEDFLNTYRYTTNKTFDETVRFYDEIRQLHGPLVALNTMRDHTIDSLSMVMSMGNKVLEFRVNLG